MSVTDGCNHIEAGRVNAWRVKAGRAAASHATPVYSQERSTHAISCVNPGQAPPLGPVYLSLTVSEKRCICERHTRGPCGGARQSKSLQRAHSDEMSVLLRVKVRRTWVFQGADMDEDLPSAHAVSRGLRPALSLHSLVAAQRHCRATASQRSGREAAAHALSSAHNGVAAHRRSGWAAQQMYYRAHTAAQPQSGAAARQLSGCTVECVQQCGRTAAWPHSGAASLPHSKCTVERAQRRSGGAARHSGGAHLRS